MSGETLPAAVCQPARPVIRQLAARLRTAWTDRPDPDDPVRDAALLLGLALGREEAVWPHQDIILDEAASERLNQLLERRLDGEPVARLRGWREFHGLRFTLNNATLDPRPDSETLVEAAIRWFDGTRRNNGRLTEQRQDCRLLDLGTGSGCLLLAVLAELPLASGVGVDLSASALCQAAANARALGLAGRCRWVVSDWAAAISGSFDVILCNPPYIPAGEIGGLAPEVRSHDPLLALDGGLDGLAAWRRLLPEFARLLRPEGRGFVEIGHDQAETVGNLATAAGLEIYRHHHDLGGHLRVLELAIA